MASRSDERGQRSAEVVLALRAESARRVQAARARRARIGAALSTTALLLLAAEGAALRWFARPEVVPQVAHPVPCTPPEEREFEGRLRQLIEMGELIREFSAPRLNGAVGAEPRGYHGPLPKAEVVRGMKELRGRLERCSLDDPGPRVLVIMDVTIGISGRVKSVGVMSKYSGTTWSVCLKAAAATARFAQSEEESGASYPFLLSPPRFIPDRSSDGCAASAAPFRSLSVADVEAKLAAACSGPEGLEACAPANFATTFAAELPVVRKNRAELEDIWIDELRGGGSQAAYGLAWLGTTKALPDLRRRLLAERDLYDWHGAQPGYPEPLPPDYMLPRQSALIMAIEHLSGCTARSAVKLTRAERRALVREATAARTWRRHAPSQDAVVARWLLHKLDGDPAPRRGAEVDDACPAYDNPLYGL